MRRWGCYLGVVLGIAGSVALAACSTGVERPPGEQMQGIAALSLNPTRQTATAAAATASIATARTSRKSTATAEWSPSGIRTLARDYTSLELAGTLVARYTSTPTPTNTLTPTPTRTPTRTPTPVPTATP